MAVRMSHLALFCVIILHTVNAQLTEEELETIDNFMNEILTCRGFPGAAISLVKDEEVVLTKGYGYANLENQEPFTSESKFGIASVSKHMTGTLGAKMLRQAPEYMSWDTIARNILGDNFHFIDGYRSNYTMLRDLMSHQTAISGYDAMWILDGLEDRESLVMDKFRFMKESYPIRSEFVYNSNAFSIVGMVFEKVFNRTWQDMMEEELFEPLGMLDSSSYDKVVPSGNYDGFATMYNFNITAEDPTVLQPSPNDMWSGAPIAGPGASITSTARDMGLWLQFVLRRGLTANGTRLVREDEMERLWAGETAQWEYNDGMPEDPVTDSRPLYGLGYSGGHYRGYEAHSHGGDLNGFHGEIFLLRDMGIGTYFVTNYGAHSGERTYIHRFLGDVLLGVEPAYNASYICGLYDDSIESKDTYVTDDDVFEKLQTKFSEEELNVLDELGLISSVLRYDEKRSSSMLQLTKQESIAAHYSKLMLEEQDLKLNRDIENYVGQYGEFIHGNLTVSPSPICSECLLVEYGNWAVYTLYPTNATDFFIGYNIYPLWDWTSFNFSGQDEFGNAQFVLPRLWEWSYPPNFERGLTMSDAPPPRNDICGPSF